MSDTSANTTDPETPEATGETETTGATAPETPGVEPPAVSGTSEDPSLDELGAAPPIFILGGRNPN